ncbi:MAG: M23 family metallopeptidase [Spirochaetaceae bacterium]|jgi:murein DD-endopeptidase MepM/ murein hydrolase activator NlpD|nr:M23 family metallopeptidase [Spirochaetaceae bacterium]
MNRRYRAFNSFLYMLALGLAAAAGINAQETIHIVQRGETIYSIARSYKVDIDELMRFNGVLDPQKLRAGQRLAIPAGTASGLGEYRVKRGDTLYSIARQYDITLQSLRNANNFSEAYVLKEGDLLKIPLKPEERHRAGETALPPPAPSSASGRPPPFGSSGTRVMEPKAVDDSIRWPVAAKAVLYMTGKLYGVALLGERSEPVKSLTQGTVVSAGPYRGFGKVAIVQVSGGYLYVYGGCESLTVKEGDKVKPGSELGKLGIDAVSRKPQLFFLVYQSSTPIDPAKAPRA